MVIMAIVMDWSAVIILLSVGQRLFCRVVSEMRESCTLIGKVGMLSCYQGLNISMMDTRVDVGVMIHFFVHNSMMTHIEREIVVNNVMVNNMVVIDHVGHTMSNNIILLLLMSMGFMNGVLLCFMVRGNLCMMTFCSLGVGMTSFFVSFGMLVSFSRLVVLLILSWLSGVLIIVGRLVLMCGLVLFGGLCVVGVVITMAVNRLEGMS